MTVPPDLTRLEIRPAANGDEQREALGIILQQAGSLHPDHDVDLLLAQRDQGQLDLTYLLIASSHRESSTSIEQSTLGTILMILQPGGVALLWPPALIEPLREQTNHQLSKQLRIRLIEQATHFLSPDQAHLFQTSLSDEEPTWNIQAFLENGFAELGNMLFLQRPFCSSPPAGTAMVEKMKLTEQGSLQLVPYHLRYDDAQLADLIDQTYEQSNDFPELDSHRSGQLAIESHRSQGEYRPDRWYLLEVDGIPIGVMLFGEHSELNQYELIYLGIAKKFRHQGFGSSALRRVLHQFDEEQKSVFVGVDARNTSAVRLYRSAGFVVLSKQRIFSCPHPTASKRNQQEFNIGPEST